MLVKPSAAAAPAANVYDNEQLLATTPYGQFGIAWSTSGVKAWHADSGGVRYQTPWFTLAGGAWAMIEVTYNGTTLSIDVNHSGSPQTVSAANINLVVTGTIPLIMGANYTASNCTTESVLVCGVAPSVLTPTNLANIKSAFNSTYGLSL
jgi:hypothetical protein